jgi:hypothetical protein
MAFMFEKLAVYQKAVEFAPGCVTDKNVSAPLLVSPAGASVARSFRKKGMVKSPAWRIY